MDGRSNKRKKCFKMFINDLPMTHNPRLIGYILCTREMGVSRIDY